MGNEFRRVLWLGFFFFGGVATNFVEDITSPESSRNAKAVIVDGSDGNVKSVRDFWYTRNINLSGQIWFGQLNGLSKEPLIKLEDFQQLKTRMRSLDSPGKTDAPASDLFSYLSHALSMVPTRTDIILFTGRHVNSEPELKVYLDALTEKKCRLFVVWTGDSTSGLGLLENLAKTSKGTLEKLSDIPEKKEYPEKGIDLDEDVMEIKPRKIYDMLQPNNDGLIGPGRKSEAVRFPGEVSNQASAESSSVTGKSIPSGKQQTRINFFVPKTKVEVSSTSSLEAMPGSEHRLQYDVTNNLHDPARLRFSINQPQNVRVMRIQPESQMLRPMETIRVEVTVQPYPDIQNGGEGTFGFAAVGEDGGAIIRQTKVYFTNRKTVDNTDPKFTYTYMGDCRGHDKPDTCDTGEWKIEATFHDEESGLKKILSEPYGLIFKTVFEAGTKTPVSVFYTASCCIPKIDIWAEDGKGNYVKKAFDVNNQGLLTGEIAAIAVGAILLLFIIIAIIVAVVLIRKRNQRKLVLPRYQSGN